MLKQAPVKYYQAFLYSESDENDLTYFLLHQSDVIRKAIDKLNDYISRKTREARESERILKDMRHLNHRQQVLVGHALLHPSAAYTIEGHQISHNVAYNTARTDLLNLEMRGLFKQVKSGKKMVFYATTLLEELLHSTG